MNLESLLMYGLAAVGGWLLRHVGFGAGVKVPGVSPSGGTSVSPVGGTSVSPVGGTSTLPVMATLKADIDQIVKSAVEVSVKQAIDDIKGAAAKG